jgi:hypothetical protein
MPTESNSRNETTHGNTVRMIYDIPYGNLVSKETETPTWRDQGLATNICANIGFCGNVRVPFSDLGAVRDVLVDQGDSESLNRRVSSRSLGGLAMADANRFCIGWIKVT